MGSEVEKANFHWAAFQDIPVYGVDTRDCAKQDHYSLVFEFEGHPSRNVYSTMKPFNMRDFVRCVEQARSEHRGKILRIWMPSSAALAFYNLTSTEREVGGERTGDNHS